MIFLSKSIPKRKKKLIESKTESQTFSSHLPKASKHDTRKKIKIKLNKIK
jgi:hypothetical protein